MTRTMKIVPNPSTLTRMSFLNNSWLAAARVPMMPTAKNKLCSGWLIGGDEILCSLNHSADRFAFVICQKKSDRRRDKIILFELDKPVTVLIRRAREIGTKDGLDLRIGPWEHLPLGLSLCQGRADRCENIDEGEADANCRVLLHIALEFFNNGKDGRGRPRNLCRFHVQARRLTLQLRQTSPEYAHRPRCMGRRGLATTWPRSDHLW